MKNNRSLSGFLIACACLLACCDISFAEPLAIADVTQAARASTGPGAQNSQSCAAPYGDAPEAQTPLAADAWLGYLNSCAILGGERQYWKDPDGNSRNACLITPPQASPQKPLPLLVWLHPSQIPIDGVLYTNILEQMRKADLSGDPLRPGFVLLLPEGRNIEHVYLPPDKKGFGWDNWYRNLDRRSGALNVDAAAVDHFIETAKSEGNIDSQRVYMSGWSNGASFALLYALNTPGIAAAAVYSAPAPFSDINDSCWQTPFATQATPVYDLHNSCDISGTCQTGTQFFSELASTFPQITQRSVIVNRKTGKVVNACDASCAPGATEGYTAGLANHATWPFRYTQDMFAFLRDHPLTR